MAGIVIQATHQIIYRFLRLTNNWP